VTGSPVTSSGNITINIPTASATNRGALSSADWSTFNSKVSSVGLSMPSAFSVANSPITGSGTIAVTGAGTVSQYIRGDGSLADFPQGGGGGGASVNYYLNGSVSQGTIGGIPYLEMNRTPILGAGTDFTINANGYIASFITDAGDPALLEIPGGNWNFETYFQASSGGGSPSFYVELYKVNSGGTATLIASNSANPELIAFGTTTTPYFSTLAVPTTTLALTDRLALRYYVTHAGRTITLHTENGNLCQIITTFTTGLTALNGLTAQVQNFATGTSGTDFTISSATNIHTFNLPDASATARGVITTGTQTIAGYKIFNGTIGVNNDLQLVTVGTALNTFIKNINATGITSIGSNGFGFNNANNIYFSGSSKGGGIFAFSNTGNQTYTLQDASGTLAFTTDISTAVAGYLPLTGGTLSNNLFITGGGLQVSGSTSANRQVAELYTSGSVSRLAASYVGASSYGSLELLTSGLARLTIASTGAATFSSSVGVGTSPSALLHLRNGNTEDVSGSIIRMDLSGTNPYWEIQARNGSNGANRKLGFFTSATSSDVLTLTQAGNVGIGTASPGYDGAGYGAVRYTTINNASGTGSNLELATGTTANDGYVGAVDFINTSNTGASGAGRYGIASIRGFTTNASATNTGGGYLTFNTKADGGSGAERMRITSVGKTLLIGGNTSAWANSSRSLLELDNTGSVMLGLRISGNERAYFYHNNSNLYIENMLNPGSIYVISISGGVYLTAGGTSWTSNSDERLKNINGNIENAVDKLMTLRAVNYSWKNDENQKQNLGLIAQDVEKVFPEVIDLNKLPSKPNEEQEDDTEYLGVRYQELIPVLIKAIQELKTEIDSLKNQIK
jgi:hypothetical protein